MATFPLPASIPVRSHHIPLCPTPVLAPRSADIPGLLFRRPCQGATCQPHHTTAVPCLRFRNPHQIAACCISHRSALHQPSHRTASVIAPHCVSPGRTQPSARNSISSPRFPPSDLAGKPLPVLCHLQSKNEKPRCSNRNTTAFYSLKPAGHYAPARFLISSTYFLNELQRSGATLYSYRRIT